MACRKSVCRAARLGESEKNRENGHCDFYPSGKRRHPRLNGGLKRSIVEPEKGYFRRDRLIEWTRLTYSPARLCRRGVFQRDQRALWSSLERTPTHTTHRSCRTTGAHWPPNNALTNSGEKATKGTVMFADVLTPAALLAGRERRAEKNG